MELKPCPFCGAELVKKQWPRPDGDTMTYYWHPEIGCLLDWLEVGDEQEAAMWNRRADNG